MTSLTNIGEVKALLARHGFTFSKQMGQNFLINPSVCPRMAEEGVPGTEYGVLEIGPGIGVLTRELAQRAAKVAAVELDSRLPPILEETLGDYHNVHIVEGDILKLDLKALLKREFDGMPVAVCANLPYYITSPVVMHLLESRLPVSSITVMVQKEAAQRLCARVGSRESGAVTVAVQYYAEAQMLFPVSRGSFLPAPNVDSAVIRLTPRPSPPVDAPAGPFFQVVRAGFNQRRKTLVNSLSSLLPVEREEIRSALLEAGIQENARIEQLTMEELSALTHSLFKE